MKRTIPFILMLCTLCSLLGACGNPEIPETTAQTSATTVPTALGEAAVSPPATTEAAQETTEASQETTVPTQASTAPEETENSLAMGYLENGVYINPYAGFCIELGDSWLFHPAEELQQLPENIADAVAGSELGELMANVQQFTDMMAENVEEMTSMNLLYQRLSMQERIAYAMKTEEEIADITLSQYDMLVEAYNQMGIAVQSMEKVTVTFLGQEHTAILTTATMQDVPYYALQLFDFHRGEYALTLTLASFVENNTESMLELFVPMV